MTRNSRRGYEFDKRIKEEEERKWRAKNPDKSDARVQVHHILPIYKAKQYGVPKEAVRSQENAVAVDEEFHKKVHEEMDEETYWFLAQYFINLYRKLF